MPPRLRVLLLMMVLPASTADAKPKYVPPPVRPSEERADIVSMVQLIATPERFDGKTLQVVGFLDIEFEGTALYLHREDYEYAVYKNALSIQVPDRWLKTPPGYVIVEATFDASKHGHMGAFQGTLLNVTRLDRWGRRPTGR